VRQSAAFLQQSPNPILTPSFEETAPKQSRRLVEPINPLCKRIEQDASVTDEMQLRACSSGRSGGVVLPMKSARCVTVFHCLPACYSSITNWRTVSRLTLSTSETQRSQTSVYRQMKLFLRATDTLTLSDGHYRFRQIALLTVGVLQLQFFLNTPSYGFDVFFMYCAYVIYCLFSLSFFISWLRH
jgi:hypothetical protein